MELFLKPQRSGTETFGDVIRLFLPFIIDLKDSEISKFPIIEHTTKIAESFPPIV